MAEANLDQLAQLWGEFRGMPFPPGFYLREPEGECVVMMDSTLAGCIASALDGPLDARHRDILQGRTAKLGTILPSIADDEYATKYFTHLHGTAVLAAEVNRARSE
ncbi:hypothetical protein HUT16_01485 [Kitasatospora sp. NA04385]|uniref:hypothetical protein n=1 Tax=Kitasatospora sp. NA04385 TaxID=2742135 RepID=UPI0015926E11|nr:hypothetical protein [Kitasatospora sp. NA04385]QKW17907.1 hypothetical protein HUT16_01485 [Kitasatospora sp. NA04385]